MGIVTHGYGGTTAAIPTTGYGGSIEIIQSIIINPFVITQPGTKIEGPLFIKNFFWDAHKADESIVIKDMDGNTLWSAQSDDNFQSFDRPFWAWTKVNGLNIETLTEGILFVYLD